MAEIFNDQRVLGVRLVEDGTILHNNQPVIGIVPADGVSFVDNKRVLGVEIIEDDRPIHNDQPVIGAVVIEDERELYNSQPVAPVKEMAE